MSTVDRPKTTKRGLRAADRAEVQVLIDNVTDQLSTNPKGVLSELDCLMQAGLTVCGGGTICCAHFGLSLVVTVYSGGARQSVLFDGGPEGFAIERNGRLLGVDFGGIEAVVLSHGHWDHAGGLPMALELIRAARPDRTVPVYVHPGMFRTRGDLLSDGTILINQEIPSVETLSETGKVVLSTESQFLVGDLFYLSGEIARVTPYERGLPGHMSRSEDGSDWVPDPLIMDERYLAVNIRDKGLLVFTACSHAGVVNVLTDARRVFPDIPLYGVMGGFHLSGEGPEKIISQTVKDLSSFKLSMIVPGHCTGWRAVNALVNAFGEKIVVPSAVGKRYDL